MEKVSDMSLCYEFAHRIDADAVLCSDGAPVYKSLARHLDLTHKPLNIKKGKRVIEKAFHIQTVNSYHSKIRLWTSRFRGIATKYLKNYLGWFRWMEVNQSFCTPQAWLLSAFKGVAPNPKLRISHT